MATVMAAGATAEVRYYGGYGYAAPYHGGYGAYDYEEPVVVQRRVYSDYNEPVVRRGIYRERAVSMTRCRTVTVQRPNGTLRHVRRCAIIGIRSAN